MPRSDFCRRTCSTELRTAPQASAIQADTTDHDWQTQGAPQQGTGHTACTCPGNPVGRPHEQATKSGGCGKPPRQKATSIVCRPHILPQPSPSLALDLSPDHPSTSQSPTSLHQPCVRSETSSAAVGRSGQTHQQDTTSETLRTGAPRAQQLDS